MIEQVWVGLLCAGALWGQSLHVPPSSTDKSGAGSFSVFLDSPEGKAPVALQWELQVPSMLVITAADITAGKAAESGGKSVICAIGGNNPGMKDGVRYTCILAGGINRIPNGPVAVVHYRVAGSYRRGRIRVTIESAMGVSLDLKSTAIGDAIASITKR